MAKTKKVFTENGPASLENLVCDILNCKFGMDCCDENSGIGQGFQLFITKTTPSEPNEGDYWFDPVTGEVKYYNGTNWGTKVQYIINGSTSVAINTNTVTNNIDFATTEGKLTLSRIPVGDNTIQFVTLQEVAPGQFSVMAGLTSVDNSNFSFLYANETGVSLRSTADITTDLIEIEASDLAATMKFTDINGSGVDNSTITAGAGIVNLDAKTVVVNSSDFRIDLPGDVVTNVPYILTIDNADGKVYKVKKQKDYATSSSGTLSAYIATESVVVSATAAGPADITLTLPATTDIIGVEYCILNDANSAFNVLVDRGVGVAINGNTASPVTIQPGRGVIFRAFATNKWFCSFI